MRKLTILLWFLLVATPAMAGPVIGEETSQSTNTAMVYQSVLGETPADGSLQGYNPPIFKWHYMETISNIYSLTTRKFQLQLSTNNFSTIYETVATSNNYDNSIYPVTNSDGSSWMGTTYWRVLYQQLDGTAVATGPTHTYTLASSPTLWDRSMLGDTNYLLSKLTNYPGMWFTNGIINSLHDFWQFSSNWPYAQTSFSTITNSARQAQTNDWWTTNTFASIDVRNLCDPVEEVIFAYYFSQSNAMFDINGACSNLDKIATALRIQGLGGLTAPIPWYQSDPYTFDPGTLTRFCLGYNWAHPFLTTAQRTNILNTITNWANWCARGDGNWAYNTNGVVSYESAFFLGSSHSRHNSECGLTMCMATAGDDPNMLALLPLFLNYSYVQMDPHQGQEGRSYAEQDNFKFDREFGPLVEIIWEFPEAHLERTPLLTNELQLFMHWEPVGYRGVLDGSGDLCWAFKSQGYNDRYRYLACLMNSGEMMRFYTRSYTFRLAAGDEFPLIGGAFVPYYWTPPAEADASTNVFFDKNHGWAMSSSLLPTDWGAFTNGINMFFYAAPAGRTIDHVSFTAGFLEFDAYGAQLTAGGAAQGYSKNSMFGNMPMYNGVGQRNSSRPPNFPIIANFSNWTNCTDFTYAQANILYAYNLTNVDYLPSFNTFGNLQNTEPYYATNTIPQLTDSQVAVLFPHHRYWIVRYTMGSSTNMFTEFPWHIVETNNLTVNSSDWSFSYTCTNAFNGSNVTMYAVPLNDPTTIAITNVLGTNNAELNPFTGENLMGTDANNGPWWASTLWLTNKIPTNAFTYTVAYVPQQWGVSGPTITRIDNDTVAVALNDGSGINETNTFNTNYAGAFTFKVNIGQSTPPTPPVQYTGGTVRVGTLTIH